MDHPLLAPIRQNLREFRDTISRAVQLPGIAREAVEGLRARPPASIVIPVFNAAPQLATCLKSIRRNSPEVEVVLVDDRSTEAGVSEVIEAFAGEHPGAKVVRNEANYGFASSANAGFEACAPGHDIVLLNSDTEVTASWIDKLAVGAYLEEDVATVGPLSNAAGVFTVPVEYEDSGLPDGLSAEMCNRLLEEVGPRAYDETPATSGFCIYIRRDVLARIGVFDDFLFRQGYAEDNDLCVRATQLGLKHVVDDSTFVFHQRGASFGGSRQHLKRLNSGVLKKVHPTHVEETKAWLGSTRLTEVRREYARALAGLSKLSAEQVEDALQPVGTTLRIVSGEREAAGVWNAGARTLIVSVGEEAVDLDLFGVASCRLARPGDDLFPFLAWLVNRWRVEELDASGDFLDAGDVALLLEAFRPRRAAPVTERSQ